MSDQLEAQWRDRVLEATILANKGSPMEIQITIKLTENVFGVPNLVDDELFNPFVLAL